MPKSVALVLRGGGEYTAKHVDRLVDQINIHSPFNDIICLSDVPVTTCRRINLRFDWPGWWAKMELFRPDLPGDLFYMDLDTTVLDDIEDIANVDQLAILRDFYRDGVKKPEGMQSSVMFLPEYDRHATWAAIMDMGPGEIIRRYSRMHLGDQAFLENLWQDNAAFYQDLVPGQIVSYKVHCEDQTVPRDARMVIHHGRPRPWDPGVKLNRTH